MDIRISEYQVARCVERQRDELDIRGTGVSEIVHAPNLKNKIGAGSPCTIRCRVYAHSELEKFWRESEQKKLTVTQNDMRFFPLADHLPLCGGILMSISLRRPACA